MAPIRKPLSLFALVTTLLALSGCASLSRVDQEGSTPWDKASSLSSSEKQGAQPAPSTASEAWHHRIFPGKKPNDVAYVTFDGRPAVAVRSDSAASVWRKVVDVQPDQLGALRFSWRKSDLIPDADMALRDKDDALRVVLAFDGDRSRLSARDHLMSELARAVTGEEMPYATLMYVWSNQRDVGSVILNPRTDRIRKLVVESGATGLGRWLDYERDVRADYRRVFGEEPGRLIGVGLMTDTDNTKRSAQVWYGPLSLSAPKF